jgi:hypothetical protein
MTVHERQFWQDQFRRHHHAWHEQFQADFADIPLAPFTAGLRRGGSNRSGPATPSSRSEWSGRNRRGAKLFFLPKYSPNLNPIEQVFAKLKHLLRKAAARTVEAVWDAIGQLLPAFIPKECANYFKNAGYAST